MAEGVSKALTDPAGGPLCVSALEDRAFGEAGADLGEGPESLVLYRDGDTVRAWRNVCPHAGRRLDWAPGKFLRSKDGLLVCAVHGATFEATAGLCVAGPCRGQSLRPVPVEVRDGIVHLATSA